MTHTEIRKMAEDIWDICDDGYYEKTANEITAEIAVYLSSYLLTLPTVADHKE